MNIVVFAWDFPYPPRGGGRADIWRRVQGFVRLGHRVMLVNLLDPASVRKPGPRELEAADEILAARFSFPIDRSRPRAIRQILVTGRIPWHVASRVPAPGVQARLLDEICRFAPDALWLDGPWFGEIARRLKTELGVPMLYRSHNVEHLYLRRQAAVSGRLRHRVAWTVATIGLRRYQLNLMRECRAVFDISHSDLAYWRALGISNGRWLPPLPELALRPPPRDVKSFDVVFIGGLRTPNNVSGVRWFLREVLPRVRAKRPETTVAIVGAYPDPSLADEIVNTPSVTGEFDVEDVTPYQFGAGVLINPVATGSGVQLKTLDMLMTDRPIVSRRQGLAGLPESCVDEVDVAETSSDFADAVLRRLAAAGVDVESRTQERAAFTLKALGNAFVAAGFSEQ